MEAFLLDPECRQACRLSAQSPRSPGRVHRWPGSIAQGSVLTSLLSPPPKGRDLCCCFSPFPLRVSVHLGVSLVKAFPVPAVVHVALEDRQQDSALLAWLLSKAGAFLPLLSYWVREGIRCRQTTHRAPPAQPASISTSVSKISC